MPIIDFPDTPFVGQLYQFEGRAFIWNGVGWQRFINQGGPFMIPGPNDVAFVPLLSFIRQ